MNPAPDETLSVCPVCLKRISAFRTAEGDALYLKKTCPEHGSFKTVVRRGDLGTWNVSSPYENAGNACPGLCGNCRHDEYG